MFTVSEENTVKCLKGSSDIFGNGRTSSLVFGNLRQSSGIVASLLPKKSVKWAKIASYTKPNNIGVFGDVFVSFWKKFAVSKNFLLLVLKCLKFNCSCYKAKK